MDTFIKRPLTNNVLVVSQKYITDINVIYIHRYIALILKHFVVLKYIDTALRIMNAFIAQNFLDIATPVVIVESAHSPSLCFFGNMLNFGGFFLDKRNQQLYIDTAHLPPVGPAARPLAGFCFL